MPLKNNWSGNEGMLKTTIIQTGSPLQYWSRVKEIFQYKDLIRMLSYRDIRVRYAQTWLGFLWALINPVISMFLLYIVFGMVVKADTQGVPTMLFIVAGLCAWNYFARVAGEGGTSLLTAQSLVKKVYFPRLIIPLSKAVSGMIDLLVVLILLFTMLLWFQVSLKLQSLLIIPFILLTLLTGFAFAIWISALSIRYRDFTHIVPLLLRMGMFLSPIAYGANLAPEKYRWLFQLNPLTGIMEGYRWALFDTILDPLSLIISVSMTLLMLISGIWYFFRMEQYIADIL